MERHELNLRRVEALSRNQAIKALAAKERTAHRAFMSEHRARLSQLEAEHRARLDAHRAFLSDYKARMSQLVGEHQAQLAAYRIRLAELNEARDSLTQELVETHEALRTAPIPAIDPYAYARPGATQSGSTTEDAPEPNPALVARVRAFEADPDVVGARARYRAAMALAAGPEERCAAEEKLEAFLEEANRRHGLTTADRVMLASVASPSPAPQPPPVAASPSPVPAAPPPPPLAPGEKHPTLTAPKPRYRSPAYRYRTTDREDGIGE